MRLTILKANKNLAIKIVILSLLFIYVFQYPLSLLIGISIDTSSYSLDDWVLAYVFVLLSTSIFLPTLYMGMSGKLLFTHSIVRPMFKHKIIGIFPVFFLFLLFFAWSYIMVQLKIGMTIYADFDPLPFKLTGLLFYGRLFLQPFILSYIAHSYSFSKRKRTIFILLLFLGLWTSLSSGSRFVAIMFSLPFIFLINKNSKYLIVVFIMIFYITIATLSRNFYLPIHIGAEYIIEIYGNDLYKAEVLDNLLLLPFSYIISRPMGIGEVLMTLNYGDITPGFFESLQNSISYFLPLIPKSVSISAKNIYGLNDSDFGGYSLDIYSNYWIFFGGSLIPYVVGLAFSAWLFGRTHRLFVIGLNRLEFKEAEILVFILLFILFFEGRAFLFPILFIVAWCFSRKSSIKLLLSLPNLFSLKK